MTLAGKCNLDSFAMGSTTELSDFQVRCCAVNGQILDLWACISVCGMGPFSEAPAAASQHRPAMPPLAAIIHWAQPRLRASSPEGRQHHGQAAHDWMDLLGALQACGSAGYLPCRLRDSSGSSAAVWHLLACRAPQGNANKTLMHASSC